MCPWDKPIRFFSSSYTLFFLPCIWMSIIDKREWWITSLYSFCTYIYMFTSLWSLGFDTAIYMNFWDYDIEHWEYFLWTCTLTKLIYTNQILQYILLLLVWHTSPWSMMDQGLPQNYNCMNYSSPEKRFTSFIL